MFRTPVDISNRALQHCGASRIDPTQGFAENSRNASECAFVYDKLRVAELRRNVWVFAIRTAALRAIDVTTMLLAPSLYSSTTTYFVGSIVTDETGQLWISAVPDNLGNDPQNSTAWQEYFGPLTVSLYDSTATTAYRAGELVYSTAGDGTNRVYLSRVDGNTDNPATATAWDATTTFYRNQVVTYAAVAYMSLIDFNINQRPDLAPSLWTTTFVAGAGSDKWLQIGGAEFPMGVGIGPLAIVYPLGCGPATQSGTRNAFRLPAGYLRKAPQDPKAGASPWLGAPTGRAYSDWTFEGDFLVSREAGPIALRFVADMVDVARMDPMFCEGLAARVGLEVVETLTQSADKLKTIGSLYKLTMGDARAVNAIESGPEEPAEDDYLTVRY